MATEFEYVGFWKRVSATFIDGLCLAPVGYLCLDFLYWSIEHKAFAMQIAYSIVFFYFWSIFLVTRFGGTPGKLLLGIRVVDKDGNNLSRFSALKRITFAIIVQIPHLIALKVTMDQFPGFNGEPSFLKMGEAMLTHGGEWPVIAKYIGFIFYIDVLAVVLNKKKRALHDFLAESFVVSKRSKTTQDI